MEKEELAVFFPKVILGFIFVLAVVFSGKRDGLLAGEKNMGYVTEIFGAETGLNSTEISAVAQTRDGYIWVGSYLGLYKYNGMAFHPVFTDRIDNVTGLETDSDGRLWIGTGDNGIGCYDPQNDQLTMYDKKRGLVGNSVRALAADENQMYVGTTEGICKISRDGDSITPVSLDLSGCIEDMTINTDGYLAGVTGTGELFCLKEDKLVCRINCPEEGVYYSCIAAGRDGEFLLGTSKERVDRYNPAEDPAHVRNAGKLSGQNKQSRICYDSDEDGFFIGSETGIGFFDRREYEPMNREDFDSFVSDIIVDYQSNVWAVSNKQGVAKFSQNPFENIFARYGIPEALVNACMEKDDCYYICCGNGLAVLDKKTGELLDEPYIRSLQGKEVRHITADRQGNLWISTYSSEGLICLSPDHQQRNFNSRSGTKGNRFQFSIELKDGTILASAIAGMTFIQQGKVRANIYRYKGKNLPQITDICEKEDGTIYAASDGGGIFVIRGRRIVDQIDEEDGLGTLVIRRIVPIKHEKGWIYVTGNGLYYDNEKKIRHLQNFPYSNDYDIRITDEHQAWISSSAGIYVIGEKELIEDGEYKPILFNRSRGLEEILTAEGRNFMDESENYFLCANSGVVRINAKSRHQKTGEEQYAVEVDSVHVDGREIRKDGDRYVIPADAKTVEITPAVLDYTVTNPKIHMYLEGYDKSGVTCFKDELSDMHFTNLANGTYRFHLQILGDLDNKVRREMVVTLYKDARFYEQTMFKVYLILLIVVLIGLATWILARYSSLELVRHRYSRMRREMEESEARGETRAKFFVSVLGDLQKIVNVIIKTNSRIAQEKDREERRLLSERIFRNANLVSVILEDVVDTAKIEYGIMEIRNEKYEPLDLIAGLYRQLRRMAKEKDFVFTLKADEEIPELLQGDRKRVLQITRYLVYNVFHYMLSGKVELRISQKRIVGEKSVMLVIAAICEGEFGLKESAGEQKKDLKEDPRELGESGPEFILVNTIADMMGGGIYIQRDGEKVAYWAEIPQKVYSWTGMGDAKRRIEEMDEKENGE